jgi:WD40 repeat protein
MKATHFFLRKCRETWPLGLALALMLSSWPAVRAGETGTPGVRVVAFSPDGKFLAAGTGEPKQPGTVMLWDLANRQPRWIHRERTGIPAVAFAPDGKTLAIGIYDHTAKLLDVASGQVRATLRGHNGEVRGVAFSPDGKTLATGAWDRSVKLWDVATGGEKRTLEGSRDRIFAVTFSPDGKWLAATGYDPEATVWDAATGQVVRTFRHGGSAVRTAVFTPDGQGLLTGGYEGTVRLWNARTGELRCQFRDLAGVDALAYAPATRTLAVCGFGKSIPLFELSLKEPTEKERKRIQALLAQLDDDAYEVRDAAGKELLEIGFVAEAELRRAMKESPSAEVRIRTRRLHAEMLSRPRATLTGHTDQIEGLAFSPDGKLMASASKDGTARVWDVAARKELARFVPGERDGTVR